MKRNKKLLESPNVRRLSNKNLMKILLDTKSYLKNNNNFSKKTRETDESDLTLIRKYSCNELPVMLSSKNITPFNSNTNINNLNPDVSRKQSLNKLLFRSISFDNFLKEVSDCKVYGKSQDVLPPIYQDKNKNFTELNNVSPFRHEINSYEIYSKKPALTKRKTPNNTNNNKKLLFCLESLDDIKINQKLNQINKNKIINEFNREVKYNISRDVVFRDMILNENSYKELYFQKNKYIMAPKYYNKFIISQIKQFKKAIPTEDKFHLNLEKEYLESVYNKPKLILNSLSISFKCKGKYFLFHIPFELLPIFYYQNMENLKFILINIIRFDNDYEDIYIDLEELSYILTMSKQFELEDEKLRNGNDDNRAKNKFLEKKKLLKSTKNVIRKNITNLTNNFRESLSKDIHFEKSSKLKQSIKRNKTTRVFDGLKVSPHKKNDLNEDKIYKSSFNKYLFKWITPKYEYDVEIKVPEAIFQIGKTSLRAYIDIEYIFYFIENGFENWDFHISRIIFSYKECLHYLNEFLSFIHLKKK